MRFIRPTIVSLLLVALASPAGGQDKVDYVQTTTGKPVTITGTIFKEDPSGLQVRLTTGGEPQIIATPQILDVVYADFPKELSIEFGQIQTAERGKKYQEALDGYQTLLPKIDPTNSPNTHRQVQFKIASLQALLAQSTQDSLDAAANLTTFLTAYPNSWQYTRAAKTLASMQISAERYDDAVKTLEQLAAVPGLSNAVKQDASLLMIDTLLLNKQDQAAKTAVDAALSLAEAGTPTHQRLQIYQLRTSGKSTEEMISQLQNMIATTDDQGLKALAYNTMGDIYARNEQIRDAMWSYLWVDVVFNQNPTEHLKAVDRLAKLFDKMNDTAHHEQYLTKLKELR